MCPVGFNSLTMLPYRSASIQLAASPCPESTSARWRGPRGDSLAGLARAACAVRHAACEASHAARQPLRPPRYAHPVRQAHGMRSAPCGLAPVGRSTYARARRCRASRLRAAVAKTRPQPSARLSRHLLPPERRNKRGRYACAPYGRTPREPSASPSPASSHNAIFCSGARPRRALKTAERGMPCPSTSSGPARPRSAESTPLCHGPLSAGGRARWSRWPRLGAPRTAQALHGPAAAGLSVSAAYARRWPANVAKPTLSCRLLALRP